MEISQITASFADLIRATHVQQRNGSGVVSVDSEAVSHQNTQVAATKRVFEFTRPRIKLRCPLGVRRSAQAGLHHEPEIRAGRSVVALTSLRIQPARFVIALGDAGAGLIQVRKTSTASRQAAVATRPEQFRRWFSRFSHSTPFKVHISQVVARNRIIERATALHILERSRRVGSCQPPALDDHRHAKARLRISQIARLLQQGKRALIVFLNPLRQDGEICQVMTCNTISQLAAAVIERASLLEIGRGALCQPMRQVAARARQLFFAQSSICQFHFSRV
ncbi:MAG: hypothetical protein ABJA83_05155 [Burkholderiaceae bacterium]